MFAEILLEISWRQRAHRAWMTLTSFTVQALVIAVLVTVPLLTTVGTPLARVVSTPITMGRRDSDSAAIHQQSGSSVTSVAYTGRLMMPTRIPTTITPGDMGQPPIPIGIGSDRSGDMALPFGSSINLPLPLDGTRPVMPVASAPMTHVFRTSTILEGMLVRKVQPVYPALARSVRVQGAVILDAVISRTGTIENLQLISGHPLLVPAAIEAVKQWRYRPYMLNGEAIEVETRVTVNFMLQGN